MRAECVPCQLRRALYEASLVPGSDEDAVVAAACSVLSEKFPPPEGVSNNEITTRVHEVIYQVLGTQDAYVDIKRRSNQVALQLLPEVEKMVRKSKDGFRTALLAAAVGNIMDFAISDAPSTPEQMAEMFQCLYEEGLHVDHTDMIKERMQQVDEVLYITDNAGEIVFDGLFIEEIKKLGPGVTLMVRGKPILNDATMVDVQELGLDKVADKVTTTGSFGVGIVLSRVPRDVRDEIFNAEIIVSKGMGNYEGFADVELPPIAFLMRIKCGPVAEDIGFPKGVNIAYLRE